MIRKIWLILCFVLGNSLLLFSQNCHIGDIIVNPDGSKGVVFWVNDTRTAGWMVAMEDASASVRWGTTTLVNDVLFPSNTSSPINVYNSLMAEFDGKENTRKIREKAQTTSGWPSNNYAAGEVDYENGWYLPSIGQLRILFGNLALVEDKLSSNNEFTTLSRESGKKYWSSTQNGPNSAWTVNVEGCYIISNQKTNYNMVRAIRDFEMTGGFASYQWSPIDNSTADMYVWQEANYTVTVTMGNSCSASDSQYITVESMDDVVLPPVTACESYEWEGETYTVSGNYTKVFTTPAGCEYNMTLPLTIINRPSITLIADDEVICEGESTTLHAVIQQASVGDILCTDGTFVHPTDWSSSSGKSAKGVIFYVDGSGSHGWALGLNDLGTAKWCSAETTVPGLAYITSTRQAILDIDGASNTQKIRAAGNATKYPAVWLITEQMYNDGWYLPAMGQLRYMYANFYTVNYALQKVGGSTLLDTESWFYWTSTQHSAQKKWELGYRGDVTSYNGTTGTPKVRAVCSF